MDGTTQAMRSGRREVDGRLEGSPVVCTTQPPRHSLCRLRVASDVAVHLAALDSSRRNDSLVYRSIQARGVQPS